MKDAKGFTLIELMITVAIVGILAAVAIPQYRQYIVKGNRAAAQAFMMDIASREKQYLLDARAYIAGDNSAASAVLSGLNMTIPKDVYTNYAIAVSAPPAATPPTFMITASPVVGKPQASDGDLTLDDAGSKTWGTATNW